MRLYKIYKYKSTKYKIDGGEIFARLIGTYEDIAKQKRDEFHASASQV